MVYPGVTHEYGTEALSPLVVKNEFTNIRSLGIYLTVNGKRRYFESFKRKTLD